MKHDLAAELAKGLKTDHLGHEKNVPETGSNTRNDYSFKTLLFIKIALAFQVFGLIITFNFPIRHPVAKVTVSNITDK